jgi:serine/threonine protein kinase
MAESGEKLLTTPGSSHNTPFPFGGRGLVTDRQQTVVSAPRRADAANDSGSSLPTVAAPMLERLFPELTAQIPADDVAGVRIGHFTLERRIGSGGMGTVFLARDESLQRPVALKVLAPQQTADSGSVQRFQNEARSAARLDHDNIARVFFYGEEQGLHYIAYEFVQGVNLRELIRARGRLDPAEVVSYAVQLAAALCHTSSSGVVHRDIKPSNIIITPQGKAKLVDLGLARKESLEESAQLTVAGTTLGTFDYISPEQAKDPRGVDVRSDIYSLGGTLYHALTGEPPFPEGTVLQRLLDHQDKPPPDPVLKNRRVPPALSAVLRKMMAVDLRRRYASAEDLLRDLVIVANTMGLRGVAAELPASASWPALPQVSRVQTVGWSLTAVAMIAAVATLSFNPDLLLTASSGTRPSATVRPAVEPVAQEPSPAAPTVPETGSHKPPVTAASSGHSAPKPTGKPSPEATVDHEVPFGPLPLFPDAPMDATGVVPNSLFDDPKLPVLSHLGPSKNGVNGNDRASTPTFNGLEPAPKPTESSPSTTVAERTTTETSKPTRVSERPPATTLAERTGPFVVGGKSFESLDAACAEIRDAAPAVIELHFDGRLPVAQHSLRLVNKRVTIQAAKGRQPVLWFAPREPIVDAHQSRMIYVAGGGLAVVNVALELQVPDVSTAELWTLFSCARPDHLRLNGVTATLVNPRHHAATLVEMASPVGEALSKMGVMREGMPIIPTDLTVERSVLRGEGTGFRLRDATAIRCNFEQSLFAVGEWLILSELPPQAMQTAAKLTVTLNHTTCLLGNGLYSTRGGDLSRKQLPDEFLSRNNLFAGTPQQPLLDQQLGFDQMNARELIVWSGERNYFDQWEQFWSVQATGGAAMERWTFDDWCSFWGPRETAGSRNDPIAWERPWRQRKWSEITPDDARLDNEAALNPPRAAVDGTDAGAVIDQLPSPPAAAR